MDNFRIGQAYHVEPSLNRVTGPGGSVRLEPKVMMVLVCLAERAGQMVPKDRLLHSAWADTAVGDDVLTRAVSELRHLFDDDPKQPRVIETIPKSGYRLIAPIDLVSGQGDRSATTLPIADAEASADLATAKETHVTTLRLRRHRLIAVGATAAAVAAVAGAWLLRTPRLPPPLALRVVPLTTLSGTEYGAAFSPDGRQVAFAWNGEVPGGATRNWWQGDWDIYVKIVGSSEIRRLTSGPGLDLAPAWSPDGREIAYMRSEPPGPWRIRVMSALGGSDRQVSDFPVMLPAIWSPDGRYLVAGGRSGPPDAPPPSRGLYVIPAQGGAPRAITRPRTGVHQSPAFSPDGRRLAYIACDDGAAWGCDVQVVDLDSSFSPVGPSRPLTGRLRLYVSGLAWTRDGSSIVFNAEDDILMLNYLWRVGVDGQHPPERIEVAGVNALFPSTSPTGDRLAFARLFHDEDIYRFQPGRSAQPVAQSSAFEGLPAFSPDGGRIAFASARSGDAMDVWVADADGAKPAQLTHGPGRFQTAPAWSPDGRAIAFQSSQAGDGHPHIWTVDSEGGSPKQITRDAGDQMDPSWSRDGEWIYFSWTRANDRDIWRTRVRTGSKEQVTHSGGFMGRESADGRTLLYIPKAADSPLLAQPIAGGAPSPIITCVANTAFSVNASGIFYVPCSKDAKPDPDPFVQVMNPIGGTTREVGRLEKFEYDTLPSGFAVSPDGRTILYSRLVKDEADLMVIENFK